MLRGSFIKIWYRLATAALVLGSCTPKTGNDENTQTFSPSVSEITPLTYANWNGEGLDSINPVATKASADPEIMMALSACECAPGLNAKFFAISALTQGVLPQVLVPTIRQKIASDSTLDMLNSLPPGLGGLMAGLFATDDKIYTSVRDGLQDTLSKSLASSGNTTLSARMPFRLDLFTTSVIAPAGYPLAFDIKSQAARWNMVMSTGPMWKRAMPADGVDHGLQLLETMRVIAEWAYLAGIGSDGAPDGYGGLAASVDGQAGTIAKPENPETASDSWAIYVSGKFNVSYPNASSLDLATRVKEKWSAEADGVSLEEQAMVWRSAALAFAKMRSDRLGEAESLFSNPDGALSTSMAKLPLLWLPSMGAMLTTKYLNKETLDILEYAFPKEGQQRKASLRSLLRAAQAIQQWRLATTDITKANLSESLNKRLATLPDDLVMPLQLITRNILNQFTSIQNQNGETWVTPIREDGSLETDAALIAEMIVTLTSLDQALFNSPDLKDRLTSLYHWHAKHILLPKLSGIDSVPPSMILWNVKAADVMGQYPDAAPWVKTLKARLRSAAVGIVL